MVESIYGVPVFNIERPGPNIQDKINGIGAARHS
jgi:hypothetical protein